MASNNSPAVAASPSAPTSTPGAHSRHITDIPSTSDSDTLIIDPDVNESTHDINALQHSGAPHIPWWKRPSPWWIMCAVPISATAMSATLAPRVTIYTQLVCQDLAASSHHQGNGSTYNPTHLFFSLLSATGAYADVHGYAKFSAISDDCASDPEVLSTVAKLIAVMTTSLGVLGCLTTAWWGLFSDRRGRTTVLGISVFGLLFNDIVFIVVSMLSSGIRRGYWALIIGPIVEGLLGGSISLSAAVNAYVADTTTQENRSRFFSLALGLLFTGMTFGPAIGSLLISASSSVLSVFYLAAAAHALFGIFVWFILPESLSKEAMLASHETHITSSSPVQHRRGGLGTTLIRLFSFLSPLSVFAPPASPNPLKRTRRDWSLSLLAISYGFSLLIMGSYQYKFQYASDLFKWDSETLGYWLSIVLGARALYLMVILPVLIKWLKPRPQAIMLPTDDLDNDISNPTRATNTTVPHSSSFDLTLMRVSLLIELLCSVGLAVISDPIAFTVLTAVGALGAGFNPAAHTVALDLYVKQGGRESGRLFGALGVIRALGSQILGPAIYGLIYMSTAATFPIGIFYLSVIFFAVSLVLLSCVRLPDHPHVARGDTEETAVAVYSDDTQQEELLLDVDEVDVT